MKLYFWAGGGWCSNPFYARRLLQCHLEIKDAFSGCIWGSSPGSAKSFVLEINDPRTSRGRTHTHSSPLKIPLQTHTHHSHQRTAHQNASDQPPSTHHSIAVGGLFRCRNRVTCCSIFKFFWLEAHKKSLLRGCHGNTNYWYPFSFSALSTIEFT